MDGAQHPTRSSTSSGSAIELVVTSAGVPPRLYPLATAATASPGADSAGGESHRDMIFFAPDPELFAMNDPGPSSRPNLTSNPVAGYTIDDDPFVSPSQMDMFRVSAATSDYGPEPFVNHPRAEHSAAATPRLRRHTLRHSADLSLLSRSGTTIMSISQGLRHISVRAVNFATSSLEDEGHVHLGSDNGDERVVGESDDDGVEKVGGQNTFEAFLRMCVSGLIRVLDPEVPIYAIFTSPFSSDHSIRATSDTPVLHSAVGSTLPPPNFSSNGTLHCLRACGCKRNASEEDAVFAIDRGDLGSVPPSSQETLVLPFHWARINSSAVIASWITLVFTQTGVERRRYLIGIFRAFRATARLLTITSDTTIARMLLASVAYFVLFAIVLFSIIGTQTFKDSFRLSCYLEPTLGDPETQLTQSCGRLTEFFEGETTPLFFAHIPR
ncbi:hypothetical protein EI94DRAFT_1706200 [Lactarius quietus]|nr:hypothetical protein EI94DRAFT_1706200 [Lactarius quietus]